MKISFHHYELATIKPIQTKQTYHTRHGALLKVEFDQHLTGYADCHPWTELGDEPLDKQLSFLQKGISTKLTKRALQLAKIDADARAKKVSLFDKLAIPESHFLVRPLKDWQKQETENVLKQGFKLLKIKIGNHLQEEIASLKERIFPFCSSGIKVRLDFSNLLEPNSFELFLKEIGQAKQYIDYCEDPFTYDSAAWSRIQSAHRVPLACDYQSEKAFLDHASAQVLVAKPAIQLLNFSEAKNQRVVFTSYLDHPLGQVAAAYVAAKTYQQNPEKKETCGLLSHFAYKPNEFSEALVSHGPKMEAPVGTGFGFDHLLEKISWVK